MHGTSTKDYPGTGAQACHRMLDRFRTAVMDGRATSRHKGGTVGETDYRTGDTRHLSFGPGEGTVHDLTDIGTADLAVATVEALGGVNPPLPPPDA